MGGSKRLLRGAGEGKLRIKRKGAVTDRRVTQKVVWGARRNRTKQPREQPVPYFFLQLKQDSAHTGARTTPPSKNRKKGAVCPKLVLSSC